MLKEAKVFFNCNLFRPCYKMIGHAKKYIIFYTIAKYVRIGKVTITLNKITYRSVTDNFSKTAVENIFIKNFMPNADGDFVRVYLYGLMNSQHPNQPSLSNAELAKKLGIKESTVTL